MNTLGGLEVVVVGDHPKMTLSPDVPVTDEFRAETNLWMLRFFGTTCLVKDGETIVSRVNGKVFVNARTLHELKLVMAEQAR